MKIEIDLTKIRENLRNAMRECGYAPEGVEESTGELKFFRSIRGGRYPRFHIYCRVLPDDTKAVLNLHLDQKQPSYAGSAAHSGEYEGSVVEAEAARIQSHLYF
ncbi:MAG: hypothetical protein HYW95_03355 [Candidatus Wildermuthbacteria bacterium]|nr:hypothetical protein [Candidatus Wildermuthbacteria bacterium]